MVYVFHAARPAAEALNPAISSQCGTRKTAAQICPNCIRSYPVKSPAPVIAFILVFILAAAFALSGDADAVAAADLAGALREEALFRAYRTRFDNVYSLPDVESNGFRIDEAQIFEIGHHNLGSLTLVPALCGETNRLALFFFREDGSLAYKTDDFAGNYWNKGSARQPNAGLVCICPYDLTGGGLVDLVVITRCENASGPYAGQPYNVGDVLFQNESGYYRDYRVSDMINRFDMNKDYFPIVTLIRYGVSTEFLFTAKTLDELLENGFYPNSSWRATEYLEKFGLVEIVPGIFPVGGRYYFMIYIVDGEGRILWNFQPMRHYENFYHIVDLSFQDVDGDGSKDVSILARYALSDEHGRGVLYKDYEIYYQRAGYFLRDEAFKSSRPCGEEDELSELIALARGYIHD